MLSDSMFLSPLLVIAVLIITIFSSFFSFSDHCVLVASSSCTPAFVPDLLLFFSAVMPINVHLLNQAEEAGLGLEFLSVHQDIEAPLTLLFVQEAFHPKGLGSPGIFVAKDPARDFVGLERIV